MRCTSAEEVLALIESLRNRPPFFCELVGENGFNLLVGIGGDVGCAQLSRTDGLTVKTLAPSHPDPHYAATRSFYEAMNFLPIELFPTLWGPANPCLLMARVI